MLGITLTIAAFIALSAVVLRRQRRDPHRQARKRANRASYPAERKIRL